MVAAFAQLGFKLRGHPLGLFPTLSTAGPFHLGGFTFLPARHRVPPLHHVVPTIGKLHNAYFDPITHGVISQERPWAVIPVEKRCETPRGLAPRLCGSSLGYAHGYHGPGPVVRKPS